MSVIDKKVMQLLHAKQYKFCLVSAIWFDEHITTYETEAEMQEQIYWLNQSNKDSPGHYEVLHKFKLRKMK